MPTFKTVVLQHQKKRDGTYNIKIRVTHKRLMKYLPTPFFATKEDLTRAFKIKNQFYVDETDSIIKGYRETCNKHSASLDYLTIDQVVDLLHEEKKAFELDIVEYSKRKIDEMREEGKKGAAANYNAMINNLKLFTGHDVISFREITVNFINDWMKWIGDQPAPKDKVKGNRAPSLYAGLLRALYNRAKQEYNNEDIGIIRIPFSPFKRVKIPTPPATKKRALTAPQIKNISELDYTDSKRFNLAKDVFMLSFYLVGMNSVDLFNCTVLKDGRITYERTKTRTRREDRAEISIKIT